jgi:glycosyltransferase involved in cell wall biosynthesis
MIMQLRKVIKEHQIDIVHSHLNPAGFYTTIALPKNIKQIHTLHTIYSADTQTRRVLLKLEKYILLKNKNTSLIFLSEFLKKDFLDHMHFKGKTFVLNNFIEDTFFKEVEKKENETFKIIAVGNLKPVKNYEYLFDIFEYLKNTPVSLQVYGEGDIEKYQTLIDKKKVNIKLMGQNLKMHDVLPMYDLFIMASKFEGYPISVMEAMASGVPCMLSNISSLKDMAGENAIYFDLGNAEATANTIKQIVEKKINIRDMANQAKLYAHKAERKFYIKKLLSIYDDITKT